MKCLDAIESRCSIRKFSNKKVHWDKVIEAIDAANQAPFAGNINNLKFIIVQDPKKIEILTNCCQQSWMKDASYVVVVCSNSKELVNQYGDRGINYNKQQAGAAIQNFLLRITELKLASCWIGAFADNQIMRELRIPETYEIEAVLPIGHPLNKKSKPARKISVDKKIFWEVWDQKKKPTGYKDPRS
jgi:nitroreductase